MQLVFILSLIGLSAHAQTTPSVNLIAHIGTHSKVAKKNIDSEINFNLVVENIGDADFNGTLKFKPFLVAGDEIPDGLNSGNSAVLATQASAVRIAAGQSATIAYHGTLPKLRSAPWMLAAFINSDASVVESNYVDNVTDLSDLGEFAVTNAPTISQRFDLHSHFSGDPRASQGGLATLLRTIVRGDASQFPSSTIDSRALWARFMLADRNTKKIYSLPYISYGTAPRPDCGPVNSPAIDKNWFAISYADETDEIGRIFVDYYSQAPCLNGVPPGNYVILTLMNSRDSVPERDHSNNLDVTNFELTGLDINSADQEVWMAQSDSTPANRSVVFGSAYGSSLHWKAALSSELSNVTLSSADGMVGGPTAANSQVGLNWNGLSDKEIISGKLNLSINEFPGVTQSVPVMLFKQGMNRPELSMLSASSVIDVSQLSGEQLGSFDIKNTGSAPLLWKAKPAGKWMQMLTDSGILAPGASMKIVYRVQPNKLSLGVQSAGLIHLYTNTDESYHELNVGLRWK